VTAYETAICPLWVIKRLARVKVSTRRPPSPEHANGA